MLQMKYSKLEQGNLVKTPDGIGMFLKIGVRQVLDNKTGKKLEEVALVFIDEETKWYHIRDITLLT